MPDTDVLNYLPLVGHDPLTPEWYAARRDHLGASEFAACLGESEYRQPLDVYLEKVGLKDPFEGNDKTERGKRFEPFIAAEYQHVTGHAVETGLPMYFHGHYQFLGATPDGRRKDDPLYGVETKACNQRQAAKLGNEETDEIFSEWLLQAHGQMLVCGFHTVDVFVMVSLHEYRRYVVKRNDELLRHMVARLTEFWDRILRRDPPPPDYHKSETPKLLSDLYGYDKASVVELSEEDADVWAKYQRNKTMIKCWDEENVALRAQIINSMGGAGIGRLPHGTREIVNSVVADSLWDESHIVEAQQKQGQVKRRGYPRLTERQVK